MHFPSILPTVGMLLLVTLLGRLDMGDAAFARKLLLNIVLVVALYHGAVEVTSSAYAAFLCGAIIGFFLYVFHSIACEYSRVDIAKKTAYGTVLSGVAGVFGYGLLLISKRLP
jgi:hypothetical protein